MTETDVVSEDLVFAQALADGDSMAVLEFDNRYRPIVRHAFGRAFGRWRPDRPVELEDFVQDFVGFLFEDSGRRLRSFSGRARFTTWLYTVALRYFQRALSRLAKDKRSDIVLTAIPDQTRHNPEIQLQVSEDARRIRRAVTSLPADDQLYVRLFFFDGLNATEVARTLGKGTSAVRMRKMRIVEKLRAVLEAGD